MISAHRIFSHKQNERGDVSVKSIHQEALTLGVCYYPEHWKESLWREDLQRMKAYGLTVIRIAEFAWNKFEPEEGVYTFEFFDRFMQVALEEQMQVIFCTPTATPPAWLSEKYPEILNADLDGTLYRHGMRRHYNYNSPVYRRFCADIVEKLAAHYCPYPNVIGWQIDNELNCEKDVFYSESDHRAFRTYLKEKYKTLDNLNECLGTVFWNQTYSDWNQIFLPRPTYQNSANPHLALEERKFISHSVIEFADLQAQIIRRYAPKGQYITTNGLFGHVDYNELVERSLDFIMYDSYPLFGFERKDQPPKKDDLKDRNWSWNLTRVRAISPNFGIMEQQSGAGGWVSGIATPMPKPGQIRLWTMQSIAHGADYIGYFRWRTSWIGTEIYWHGWNDYSNQPNRRLEELKGIHHDVAAIERLAGAKYQARVAVLKDYPNEWDGDSDQWSAQVNRLSDKGWFEAAQLTHTPCDFLYLNETVTLQALCQYDLLVYPHAVILTECTANLLRQYVEQGGTLILGCRTGYKDEYGRCPMSPMPGFAADLCGVEVTDYTYLSPYDEMEQADWNGSMIEAPLFNDILEAHGSTAKAEAVYRGNYYDGKPALVSNKIGRGTAYYYGAAFSRQTAEAFLHKLQFAAPYQGILELPEDCELAVRQKDGTNYYFVLNYKEHEARISVKKRMTNLLTDEQITGPYELAPYGVLVLKESLA
ncbi:MAG: beta-galactosidase [Ruminococcaceae bacterium]|nr:beta-galactosidase [Oscillospiraceae bacterium]